MYNLFLCNQRLEWCNTHVQIFFGNTRANFITTVQSCSYYSFLRYINALKGRSCDSWLSGIISFSFTWLSVSPLDSLFNQNCQTIHKNSFSTTAKANLVLLVIVLTWGCKMLFKPFLCSCQLRHQLQFKFYFRAKEKAFARMQDWINFL